MMIIDYFRYRKCNFEIGERDKDTQFYVNYINREWISYKRFSKTNIIKLLSMTWVQAYQKDLFINYLKNSGKYTPEVELYFKLDDN